MSTHREEALKAIEQVAAMLACPGPIEGLSLALIRATLKYAGAEVRAIQEVKGVRKAKE